MRLALLGVAAVLHCGSVFADVLPPWSRDEPRAVYHHYTFDAAPLPTTDGAPGGVYYPEALHNPFGGVPSAWDPGYAPFAPGGDGGWSATRDGRTGVTEPGEHLWLWIPADPAIRPLAELYLQVTWRNPQATSGPTPEAFGWTPASDHVNVGLPVTTALGDGWSHSRWRVTFEASPGLAGIRLHPGCGTVLLDEIVIDMLPEPATALLLGLAALALRRR